MTEDFDLSFYAAPRVIAVITPDGVVTMSEVFNIGTVRAFYLMWLELEP